MCFGVLGFLCCKGFVDRKFFKCGLSFFVVEAIDFFMTMETRDWLYQQLEEDNKFLVGDKVTVSAGGTSELVLKNPSGNGLVYVSVVEYDSNGEATGTVTKNLSVDTAGTSVDAISMRVNGDTGGNEVSVEKGGSYSGGTQQELEYIPGSGSGTAKAGGSAAGTTFLLEPGRNMRFQLTNNTNGENEQLLKLVWHELENKS